MASHRSPSPLSSKHCRNSNSTIRTSFNGNPIARPNSLINPKSSNPRTPANTPTVTDLTKRNSITRKSMSSLFQDGKENQKEVPRSKNFMSPTISAASKFNPSPRKNILTEKNDAIRTSIKFLDKGSDFKSEAPSFKPIANEPETIEEKEIVSEYPEVTVSSTVESMEMLSGLTEDSEIVNVRPSCCSLVNSPIIAPFDSDPHCSPYDPEKKSFLSPRPRFLHYKPNPRIENLLNKERSEDHEEEDDVQTLEGSFDLLENSSDAEVNEQEQEQEQDSESGDSVRGSSTDSSENVSVEKQSESKVEKPSKTRFCTGSKTISFMFLMFIVACFSISFTDSPPMDLPIYKDVRFSEIYHETVKLAGFAKESVRVLVEIFNSWSIDFVSYVSYQKTRFFSTEKTSPIRFFNLTIPGVQEEFVFNRHIGTDFVQEIQELDEERRDETEFSEEEDLAEMVVDEDLDAAEEVVEEQQSEVQIENDDFVPTKSNLEDGPVNEESNKIQSDDNGYVIESEIEVNDLETTSSQTTESLSRICFAGICIATMVVSAIWFLNRRKSNAKTTGIDHVADDNRHEESCSSSSKKDYKRKTSSNKRESLAFSSSDFSASSVSYGSFTTLERITIKNKDEVMVTPIRRSSRLLKNQH